MQTLSRTRGGCEYIIDDPNTIFSDPIHSDVSDEEFSEPESFNEDDMYGLDPHLMVMTDSSDGREYTDTSESSDVGEGEHRSTSSEVGEEEDICAKLDMSDRADDGGLLSGAETVSGQKPITHTI